MTQVARKGLKKESLRSTSISSLVTPDCIWIWISLAYQLINWLNYKRKRVVNQEKSATCNEDWKDVFKKHADSALFKILIGLFWKMVLNFAIFLKSRKIVIVNKNKVISLVKWFLIIEGRIAAFFSTSTSSTSGTRKVAISRGADAFWTASPPPTLCPM